MDFAAGLVLAAVIAASPAPQGASVGTAQVGARILVPVIIRQASGPANPAELPSHQIAKRDGVVFVEFE